MRIFKDASAFASVSVVSALMLFGAAPGYAQSAVDAAQAMASAMDGAGGGISMADQVSALEAAAAAGDPMALWQLGLMYESGEGVAQDKAKAFGYFSQIADQHADTAPKGIEADIVAHSFVKMGEYYKDGLPEAGVPQDDEYSNKLILHAASYFGDAEAQYQLARLYMNGTGVEKDVGLAVNWVAVAAKKQHAASQATLGELLWRGQEVRQRRARGLALIILAHQNAVASGKEPQWIGDLYVEALGKSDNATRTKP